MSIWVSKGGVTGLASASSRDSEVDSHYGPGSTLFSLAVFLYRFVLISDMDSELDKAIRKLTYTTTEQPLEKIRESLSQMSRSVDEVAKVSSIQGSTEIAKLVQLPLYFFKRTVDELMQLKSTIDYQDNQIIAMEARIKALENRK